MSQETPGMHGPRVGSSFDTLTSSKKKIEPKEKLKKLRHNWMFISEMPERYLQRKHWPGHRSRQIEESRSNWVIQSNQRELRIVIGIQGSFAEGAIGTRQSMIASEEATPTSNSKKQIMFQQQPIRSGSGRMEIFIFNSLSVRAQGQWKPLFSATAYPFGLRENGNLYFQQPIRSGSGRMETFIFNSLSIQAYGEWKSFLISTAYPFRLMENGNLFLFNSLSIQAHGDWNLFDQYFPLHTPQTQRRLTGSLTITTDSASFDRKSYHHNRLSVRDQQHREKTIMQNDAA
ncbi:hypothetical protein GQ457_17G010750 [Hibiscus cannabinus]